MRDPVPADPKLDALLKAQKLEQSLLFQEQPSKEQELELHLLGFCMAQLGRRHQQLEPLPGASIEELLNHNDLHHRRIDAPRHPEREEFPLMIRVRCKFLLIFYVLRKFPLIFFVLRRFPQFVAGSN